MVARGPRWEAQQRGELTYMPLKPCKKCGTFERRADNGNCCECDRRVQRVRSKARYDANPSRAIAYSIEYRANHLPKVQARLREWARERFKSDPQVREVQRLRKLTNYILRHPSKRITILGCTGLQFRQWLESQFELGMTWDNYGTDWHIDHIKPLSGFDLTDTFQFLAACHYTNTRPMLASANIKKSDAIHLHILTRQRYV